MQDTSNIKHMTSFFEKLKRGMDIKEGVEEMEPDEKKPKKKPKEIIKQGEDIEPKKFEVEVKSVEPEIKREDENEKNPPEKRGKWFGQEGQLTVDVFKDGEYLVVQSAVAGIKPENLDISIENDLIAIKGTRERTAETEDKDYFCQECYWGAFSRQIILPEEVDPSRAEASMKEGILTVKVPRIERQKKRKIVVKE